MVKKLIICASIFTVLQIVSSESQQSQKTVSCEMSCNEQFNPKEIENVKETIEKLSNTIEKFRNSNKDPESNKKLILGLVGGVIIGGGVVGLAALYFLFSVFTSR